MDKLIKKFSDIKRYPTKTNIENDRQMYVDAPVLREVSPVKKICIELAKVFNYMPPRSPQILVGYDRRILHWNRS